MSVRVSTIPSHDRVFRRVVERLAREADASSAEELESALRAMFPRVAVFRRELSGDHHHLYAYRDGRYERSTRERWWDGPGAACVCVDPSDGHLTHVSEEWAKLMGVEPMKLVGRHYSEFVLPDARVAAEAMFEMLQEAGEIDTQATVVRGDGSPLSIEIHAMRTADEIDVRWRPKQER